jgi:hypothetical protein
MKTLRECQIESITSYLSSIDIYPNNAEKVAEKVLHIIEEEELRYVLRRQEADELTHD